MEKRGDQGSLSDREKARARLADTNPVHTHIMKLGLNGALSSHAGSPAADGTLKTPPTDPEPIVEASAPEDRNYTKHEVRATSYEDLSAFTTWLLTLKPTTPTDAHASGTEKEVGTPVKQRRVAHEGKDTAPRKQVKGKEKKDKKKKKEKQDALKIAEAALSLSDKVYSETLADLLAEQGFAEQAINMYEKLSLKYPEKSRFFAAKIEKLTK